MNKFDTLDFQRIGVPEQNPKSQLRSTTYLRLFAESTNANVLLGMAAVIAEMGMMHYSGFHCTLDSRTAMPLPYLSYYPATWPQDKLHTSINILGATDASNPGPKTIQTTPPPLFEALAKRQSYETAHPVDLRSFGPTTTARLGDIVLARSGDKGANANIGFFIPTSLPSSFPASSVLYTEAWDWLRCFLTISKLKEMFAESWDNSFFVERVEFPRIMAVHFVVYGMLGKGVSGSSRLDSLGKGIGDWLLDVFVEVPVKFIGGRVRGRAVGGRYVGRERL